MDTMITPTTEPDPIDQLVPPPWPWWVRLFVGLAVVGSVGVASFLVGFGYVYPRPECCGSGGGTVPMALAPDGDSVIVQAHFFNSSGRVLDVLSADVELPGATVLEVGLADSFLSVFSATSEALPAEIAGTTSGRIVIRFVPDRCSTTSDTTGTTSGTAWGTVDLRLDVVNAWLPSIDRTYRLPDPVFEVDGQQVSVLAPDDDLRWYEFRDPLAAACALLEGTPA
jgi:hypothetical protein